MTGFYLKWQTSIEVFIFCEGFLSCVTDIESYFVIVCDGILFYMAWFLFCGVFILCYGILSFMTKFFSCVTDFLCCVMGFYLAWLNNFRVRFSNIACWVLSCVTRSPSHQIKILSHKIKILSRKIDIIR